MILMLLCFECTTLLVGSVRSRVSKLCTMYGTIALAEDALDINYNDHYTPEKKQAAASVNKQQQSNSTLGLHESGQASGAADGDAESPEAVCAMLDAQISALLKRHGIFISDFMSMCYSAMMTLQDACKDPRWLYKYAVCIGRKRPDSEESLMPLSRMPFGLLQYQIDFSSSSHLKPVSSTIVRTYTLCN